MPLLFKKTKIQDLISKLIRDMLKNSRLCYHKDLKMLFKPLKAQLRLMLWNRNLNLKTFTWNQGRIPSTSLVSAFKHILPWCEALWLYLLFSQLFIFQLCTIWVLSMQMVMLIPLQQVFFRGMLTVFMI